MLITQRYEIVQTDNNITGGEGLLAFRLSGKVFFNTEGNPQGRGKERKISCLRSMFSAGGTRDFSNLE